MRRKYSRKRPLRRNRWVGSLLIALGAALLIGAAALVGYQQLQSIQAKQAAEQALAALQEARPTAASEPTVPETTLPQETIPTEPTDPTDPPTLSFEILDGHEYVGYLEFPSLDRKLPVINIKFVDDLQIAPCLEKGSPYTDDAVISAHNYPSHFGPIRDWVGGEEVIFTDLEDNVIHYTVQFVEKISPYDVDKVMKSEHDLILYTCTPGGAERVMIACDRTES